MALKKYRVLRDTSLDGKDYKADAVVLVDEKVGATQKAAGAFDDDKAAVEHAEKTLESKVVTHKAPVEEKGIDDKSAGEQTK